jgi:predicted RNA polymerase sigma factor
LRTFHRDLPQPKRNNRLLQLRSGFGELELRRGRHNTARKHFRAALALARNPMERQFLEQRVGACERGDPPKPAILEPAACLQGAVTS